MTKRAPNIFRVSNKGGHSTVTAVAEKGPAQLMPLEEGRVERKSSLQNLFPEVCDRYQPIGIIGGGAYGVVCKARDRDGSLVAIKRIPGVLKDAQEARRALREVKLLKHFHDSPQVVDFLDVVRTADGGMSSLLLVFELMDGTLHGLLEKHRGGSLPAEQRRALMHQLMMGMRDLHSIDVVHRDLRPKNLLLRGDTLKICDFGMARQVSLRMSLLCYTTCSLYCAPEGMLANNNSYTVASDMWSVGCIFSEMICGQRLLKPIQGANTPLHRMAEMLGVPTPDHLDAINASSKFRDIAASMRAQVGEEATPPIVDLLHGIDADERDLLLRCLEYDPAKRISAEEALSHPFFSGRPMPEARTFPPFQHEEAHQPLISDLQREMRHELLCFPSFSD